MVLVVGQRGRDQRPRITKNYAERPKPSPRISSDRASTSLRPDRPAPKNTGGQVAERSRPRQRFLESGWVEVDNVLTAR
jgi:hypothetical protein